MTYSNEADLLLTRAHIAGLATSPVGRHLMSRVTVLDYIRIVDEIAARVCPGAVLDWGCGFGQISFLLQRRGLAVTSYDVAERTYSEPSTVFPEVVISRGIDPVKCLFPTRLLTRLSPMVFWSTCRMKPHHCRKFAVSCAAMELS